MTDQELKKLKDDLWHSADVLRSGAHLAANKYGQPILGLIFLRYADILFKQHKKEIMSEYEAHKGGRAEKTIKEISIEKCGFYLPECAYYDFINDSPDDANKATLVKDAMQAIEDENPFMEGVLPKEVYAQLVPEEEPELLSRIVRVFKDIPENSTIDIFGQIYEYFLGNFALAEGKDGGAFYTPASVVQYMVEVINPETGDKKFLDPACGSGGMFVQAARYMHNHNASSDDLMKFRCYGVEKEPDTVKLAKMNLLLNNVRGEITEANSFYSDPYDAVGQFDYVMANPPFNVDEVVVEKVLSDERFNTYGVPRNKTKSTKKGSDKKETVPNANYLWIGYFATALNENGRAGLVMANSASDASGSEYEIRKKMIEDGIISQMVTLPSNMFTSVTLPATLWFFDKARTKKDEILFIDARNIFTQVDRAHRKFSEEQIKNLGIITKLYNGDEEAFKALVQEYKEKLIEAPCDQHELSDDLKTKEYWQEQIDWLADKFPDGVYRDVTGLCKAVKIDGEDGIVDQEYSLNAGRYVGVVIEDDGLSEREFERIMLKTNEELNELNNEAKKLELDIQESINILFG
ncbi:MAG: type I restriction-modification system subunit M [Lachnospiraceae bacterium]|nr:type I restriction-modification system subunit M [Lachnospiraceae bacterium]